MVYLTPTSGTQSTSRSERLIFELVGGHWEVEAQTTGQMTPTADGIYTLPHHPRNKCSISHHVSNLKINPTHVESREKRALSDGRGRSHGNSNKPLILKGERSWVNKTQCQ